MFLEVVRDIRIYCYLFFMKIFFSGNCEKKGEMMTTDFVCLVYLFLFFFISTCGVSLYSQKGKKALMGFITFPNSFETMVTLKMQWSSLSSPNANSVHILWIQLRSVQGLLLIWQLGSARILQETSLCVCLRCHLHYISFWACQGEVIWTRLIGVGRAILAVGCCISWVGALDRIKRIQLTENWHLSLSATDCGSKCDQLFQILTMVTSPQLNCEPK